jgi:MoaA/NifB/PqqE/SkfB family radical SAM enzyme
MVHGARKRVVKTLLWMRIVWLAIRSYRNPLRAWRVLNRMVAERTRAQRWVTQKYAHASGRYFWNLYAPGWPSRAFDGYVQRELDRVDPFRGAPPGLQTVVLAITKRCPLQCEHCCEWAVLNAHESLDASDLQAIVARVRARGTAQLFLSGGEPLRRFPDLIAVVEAASADTDVWILSSGHGLTPERAGRLARAGLTGVALSLDHWDPAQHDRFRGLEGVFGWVERAAASAREAGLLVALSLCPTREFVSVENLDRYAALAASLGASFIQLLEPKAVGHYAGRDVALAPEQQRMLEAFADRLNIDARSRALPAVSYPDYASRNVGCRGAGDRHLYIDTDGAVHPCPFCRTPSPARVLDGDFDSTLATLQSAGCHVRLTE